MIDRLERTSAEYTVHDELSVIEVAAHQSAQYQVDRLQSDGVMFDQREVYELQKQLFINKLVAWSVAVGESDG